MGFLIDFFLVSPASWLSNLSNFLNKKYTSAMATINANTKPPVNCYKLKNENNFILSSFFKLINLKNKINP